MSQSSLLHDEAFGYPQMIVQIEPGANVIEEPNTEAEVCNLLKHSEMTDGLLATGYDQTSPQLMC
jgi:hypothetical protein